MFYAKLDADNNVERYPYTLTDLRLDNPSTSFPEYIDDETAACFGCVPVKPSEQPADTYKFNLIRTAVKKNAKWVEKWEQEPATPEQIAERTSAFAYDARKKRNQLLTDCDWTQLPDSPVDRDVWATYRQELRDVTSQAGFPWKITWPEAP